MAPLCYVATRMEASAMSAQRLEAEPRPPEVRSGGLDLETRRRMRRRLDETAWRPRPRRPLHRFYYQDLYGFIRSQVEPGARVLDLGCGDGALLASLRPSSGVGVDISARAV